MRAIVAGGRHETDRDFVWRELDRIDATRRIDCVIEGGQRKWEFDPALGYRKLVGGVDFHAFTWAGSRDRNLIVVRAEWEKFGRGAGPIRNRRMLDRERPDVLIAFPGGTGTADMVWSAKRRGLEIIMITRSET